MVGLDQLVAQAVQVAAEATLPRKRVIVIIDVLKHERAVHQLVFGVVGPELLPFQRAANRVGLVRLERLIDAPEFAPDFVTNARAGQQLVIVFIVDLNAVEALVVIQDILAQVLVDDQNDLFLEESPWRQILMQVKQVEDI